MNASVRDRPSYRLTRHFFRALFDFGILSERGAEAFTRVVLGTLAVILALGLLLTRMFLGKYGALSSGGAELYRQAVLGDAAVLLALWMWVVAIVTVLVSHSLFPDETDFRVLMPLPITRRLIFGSKLLALAAFACIFSLTMFMALLPITLMMSMGRLAGHSLAAQVAAYAVAGVSASAFVVLTIVAANGLLMVCLPRSRVHGISTLMRSAMLAALVVAAPFVLQTAVLGPRIATGSRWVYLVPPAWFLGLQRWLLGERVEFLVHLAQIAVAGIALSGAGAAVSYAVLYRRFDRIMIRALRNAAPWSERIRRLRPLQLRASQAFKGIAAFTAAVLRRSALHQGIALALSACGVALVVNGLIRSEVFTTPYDAFNPPRRVLDAVTWAPCALIFVFTIAVRASMAVPFEPRANWLFRMTEQDETRPDQLDGAGHMMRWVGVGIPIALTAPLQWLVLGPRSIIALGITGFYGLLLVEYHLRDWRRIPFTCSYLPGKRMVANSALLGFLIFNVYAGFGAGLARSGLARPSRGLLAIALLAVVVWIFRRERMRNWRVLPLMFEDLLPTEMQPLGLPRE